MKGKHIFKGGSPKFVDENDIYHDHLKTLNFELLILHAFICHITINLGDDLPSLTEI